MPAKLHQHRIYLEQEAAKELKAAFGACKGKPVLFLSSGGSALSLLAHFTPEEIPQRLTVGMLDERVSRDPAINNFLRLASTKFYWDAKANGAAFLPSIPHAYESTADFAKRLEGEMRKWLDLNDGATVIATMGIGEDAHTAGIMPMADSETFEKHFGIPGVWFAGFDGSHVPPHTHRVTVTPTFLRERVDVAIVFAKGDAKKPALDRALDPTVPLHVVPAGILRDMKDTRIFTDSF